MLVIFLGNYGLENSLFSLGKRQRISLQCLTTVHLHLSVLSLICDSCVRTLVYLVLFVAVLVTKAVWGGFVVGVFWLVAFSFQNTENVKFFLAVSSSSEVVFGPALPKLL